MLISQISLWFPLNKFVAFQKPTWKKMKPHIEPLLILFIPAIAVSLYKYALENKVSTLFLQIICGMLIYGTFCVIYFVHTKDEMILKMLRGIKGKIR